MMFIDLKVGESIMIADTKVTLLSKTGQRARLSIDAPKEIPIKKANEQQDRLANR